MEKLKDWITMNEVRELLQISSRTTIYRFMKRYRIRATKPQKQIYFNKTDIVRVMDDQAIVMGM